MKRLPFLALGLLICSSVFGQSVAIPVVTPVPGAYIGPTNVTISDATSGAVIYYTIDGSVPTVSSKKYTGPFTLTANATVQAIAVLPSSGVASSAFAVTICPVATTTWQSLPFATPQTGNFRIEFDATPSAATMDNVIGVSSGAATGYLQLSIGVRYFNAEIEAISGPAYFRATVIPYVAGTKNHFILDVTGSTYSASVDGKVIGTNLPFRSAATSLSQLSYVAEVGSSSICNLKVSATAPPVIPLVLVTITLPNAKAGVAYSTILTASGGKAPYVWTATGLPAGMTLTPAGVLSGTPSISGSLAVTATDANQAKVSENLTLTVSPIPAHSVALTWNASISAGVVGYNVYRASKKINNTLVTGTTFTDSSVTAGTNYCYTITSVDAAAAESVPSTQVCVTIPTP